MKHCPSVPLLIGCTCVGLFVGIHYRVIKAKLQGQLPPTPPAWHIWCHGGEDNI